jgi:hypothetical protein
MTRIYCDKCGIVAYQFMSEERSETIKIEKVTIFFGDKKIAELDSCEKCEQEIYNIINKFKGDKIC